MNRDLAIAVLKEVFDKCPNIYPNAITLMPSNAKGQGYHIHISAELYTESRAYLQEITAKYHLTFSEKEGRKIIYEPLL